MLKKIYDFLQKKVGAVEKDLYDVSISKEAEGQGKHYLQNSFAYLTIGLRYLFFGVLEFVVKFFVLISKTPHEGYKLLVAPIEKLELEEKELLEHHDYKAFLKMHEKTRVLSFKAVGAAVLAIVIVSLVVTVLVPVGKKILAASYTWTQSSWTGGSSTATASHPDTGTWNKYTSTTTGMLAGSTISLVPATQSFIDSSSPSIPSGATGGDFDLGTNTNTRIANGKIKLASAPPGTIALSLSPNGTFAVALKDDGTIWTWGYNGGTNGNGYGQLGLGHTTDKYLPTQVCTTARTAGTTTTNVGACSTESKTAETGFTAVSAGGNSVIALKSDGTIWTWGTNYTGYSYFYYLGLGHTTDKYLPTQVCTTARTAGTATTYVGACSTESKTAETGFTAASVGSALKSDGTIWNWGYNGNGYLGLGHTTDKYLPTQVCTTARTAGTTTTYVGACSTESKTAETGFTTVSTAGGIPVAALKSDGTIWSWGYNYYGGLGLGHTTSKYLPTQVCTTARTAGTATTNVGACSTESLLAF